MEKLEILQCLLLSTFYKYKVNAIILQNALYIDLSINQILCLVVKNVVEGNNYERIVSIYFNILLFGANETANVSPFILV